MKAFLVVSPESSGNHMLRELLESVCFSVVKHRYENIPLASVNIVVSMSMPSNNRWFNVEDILNELKSKGYDTFTLIGVREWLDTLNSQVKRGRVHDHRAAHSSTQEAYRRIFSTIGYNDFMVVNFDRMVDNPGYRNKLLEYLGLPKSNYVTNRR